MVTRSPASQQARPAPAKPPTLSPISTGSARPALAGSGKGGGAAAKRKAAREGEGAVAVAYASPTTGHLYHMNQKLQHKLLEVINHLQKQWRLYQFQQKLQENALLKKMNSNRVIAKKIFLNNLDFFTLIKIVIA